MTPDLTITTTHTVAATHSIVGILLAAGVGQRFDPTAQRFKLTQRLESGETVITCSARKLRAAVDQMVIVHGPRSVESWAQTCELDAAQLSCPQAVAGMGASLKAAVLAVPPPTTGWLIALADMPFIDPLTYQSVVEALHGGAALVRPCYANQPGHPVAVHRDKLADLIALDDATGAQTLFKRYRETIHWVPSYDPGCIQDIDVPADLIQR